MNPTFKNTFLFCLLLSQINLSQAQKKKSFNPDKQSILFNMFYNLNDGDSLEYVKKTMLRDKILILDSNSKYGRYAFVWTLIKRMELQRAKHYIEAMKQKFPDFAEGYFIAGALAEAINDSTWEQKIKKSLKLSPKSVSVYFYYANCLERRNRDADALFYFNELAKIDSLYRFLFYGRGYVQAKMGNNAEAIIDYTKVLSINKNNFQALFNRGYSYIQLANYELAEADFNAFIQMKNNFGGGYYYRGYSRYYLGKYDECCNDMRTAANFFYPKAIEYLKTACK